MSLGSSRLWEKYREEEKNAKLFELDVENFKCLVLAGAIRQLQTERKIPTERSVAVEMGISVEELWQYYKDFYVVVRRTGDRLFCVKDFESVIAYRSLGINKVFDLLIKSRCWVLFVTNLQVICDSTTVDS
jgi:hypothetical protein